jgi:hypothetical protein
MYIIDSCNGRMEREREREDGVTNAIWMIDMMNAWMDREKIGR